MNDPTLFPIKRSKRRPQKPEAPLRHWVSSDPYVPLEDSLESFSGPFYNRRPALALWLLCFVIVVLVGCAGFAVDISLMFRQDFQGQDFVISLVSGLQSTAGLMLFALFVSVCVAAVIGGVSGSLLARAPYNHSRFFDAGITYMPILSLVFVAAFVNGFQDSPMGFFLWGFFVGVLASPHMIMIIRSSIWQARTSDILLASQTFGGPLLLRVWRHAVPDVLNRLAPAFLQMIFVILIAEFIIGALGVRLGPTLGHALISAV